MEAGGFNFGAAMAAGIYFGAVPPPPPEPSSQQSLDRAVQHSGVEEVRNLLNQGFLPTKAHLLHCITSQSTDKGLAILDVLSFTDTEWEDVLCSSFDAATRCEILIENILHHLSCISSKVIGRAVSKGDEELVRFLLTFRDDKDWCNVNKELPTPRRSFGERGDEDLLPLQRVNGNVAIANLLLEHGADPNVSSFGGKNTFQLACRDGHLETVKALFQYGADPYISGKFIYLGLDCIIQTHS